MCVNVHIWCCVIYRERCGLGVGMSIYGVML